MTREREPSWAGEESKSQGAEPELITFTSGEFVLKGFIWKPEGPGPFPAIVWNHGSEKFPGTVNSIAPYFVSRGYVFFVPHRRGQGRSPGPYIMDQLNAAVSPAQRSRMLVALHEVQLQDQLAALAYLRSLTDVDQNRLVVMGASFGGILTMLAVERRSGYRVAVSCSAAAQTWRESPHLRARLTAAASKATIPVFFLQAENDYDLTIARSAAGSSPSTNKNARFEGLEELAVVVVGPPGLVIIDRLHDRLALHSRPVLGCGEVRGVPGADTGRVPKNPGTAALRFG
jgi:dienelactone hydrolase